MMKLFIHSVAETAASPLFSRPCQGASFREESEDARRSGEANRRRSRVQKGPSYTCLEHVESM